MSVFQIETPGQWNLLSRTQPQHFNDIVAQEALFRPGPLQGNMVHPYVLRRRRLHKVTYPHPCLGPVLKDTYGIILFQEQLFEVAHRFAGLSFEEADEFRRLMSKFRDPDEMEGMRRQFIEAAVQTRGVLEALANRHLLYGGQICGLWLLPLSCRFCPYCLSNRLSQSTLTGCVHGCCSGA
jgi:DNA polymerase III alpha subunit